ncbi:MAG: M28 family peptidase [Planctomycetes bacterium]|nr:M28 family peptidase [Planctomycetota bacterium]
MIDSRERNSSPSRALAGILRSLCVAALPAALMAQDRAPSDGPAVADVSKDPFAKERLEATVRHLADENFEGRGFGTEGNARAAQWIAERFAAIGLSPLGDGWFHEFKVGGKVGRNVIGVLEPTARASEAEWPQVLVAAHHDHLGRRGKAVYPGADDNASGVASVLALAEWFARHPGGLRARLVFVSFDAEEKGLIGSRRFVQQGTIDPATIRFCLVFDLIAGTFVQGEEKNFYAFGSEHSPPLADIVGRAAKGSPITPRLLGTYLIEPAGPLFSRSDYQAFRSKKVPYLFFTTATPWYYHTPFDRPERLDFDKQSRILHIARDVVDEIAKREEPLGFEFEAGASSSDARQVLQMLQRLVERREALALPERLASTIQDQLAEAERIVAAAEAGGAAALDERAKRHLQQCVISVLSAARRRPR